MKSVLLPLVALLACTGCQHDPYAELYTTRKPSPQDVVGRYKLTRHTVTGDGLSALNGRPSEVELLPDGRFIAISVPLRASDAPDRHFFEKLLDGTGHWRIDSVGGVDNGWEEKTNWGIYLASGTADLKPAGLTGSKPPYGLIFTIGDPDSGQAMFLERQK